MNRMFALATTLTLLVFAPASHASAQLLAAADGPIVYGHHHLNVTNMDEHRKFWVEALGGVVTRIGTNDLEVVKFPNALLFMREAAPSGGTKGSTVDHIAFSVTNLRQVVDRIKAGGFRMVSEAEAPPGVEVKDDIGIVDAGGVTGIAYALGPDDVKVEMVETKAQSAPIVSHHIHFFGERHAEMHAWYMKVFGAEARPAAQPTFLSAGLPGVGMNFSPSTQPMAGTQGRALDHIGFEVKDLEAFTKKLESQGVEFNIPYRQVPALGIAIAFFTDPFGTYVELTEGLDQVK